MGCSIDEGQNITVTGNSTNFDKYLSSFTPFQSGTNNLILYANDTAGKWASPQTVTYRVNIIGDETGEPKVARAPTLLLPVVSLVVLILVVSTVFLLLFRKYRKNC